MADVPGIRRRALIDLDAFAANLADRADEVLDARADAYGHGIGLVGPVARAAGVERILVSPHDVGGARAIGFRDIRTASFPVRADASAYGLDDGGRAVMSVVGEVVAIKPVPAGAGVSYGYTHRISAPTRLALVALGYADGVPRLASNRARVRIGTTTHPLVGRIAMDQLVLDIGDAPIALGDDAVLFGDVDSPTASDWARWTERDPLTLTAGIAPRVTRVAR